MTTINLKVTGMTCGHCEKAVTQAIRSLDSAAEITINRETNRVTIQTPIEPARLIAAISDEGYPTNIE
jgi:copper chaperone